MDELLNTAPCGFIAFGDDGTVNIANQTLAGWLGYTPAEIEGKHVETLFTLSSRIFYQTHFFPLITLHGKAEEIFLSLQAKDKTDVPVLANAMRKESTDGVFTNHCIFVPVHNRRKYEDELLKARKTAEDALHKNEALLKTKEELEAHKQELDKQVGRLIQINREMAEFSTIISHDVQEPVRRIIMFADIVHRGLKEHLDDASEISLQKIKDTATNMRTLVASLHQFVSVDMSGIFIGATSLQEAFEIARLKSISTLPLSASTIECTELPAIEANQQQMEQLFYNLLQNAIKFSHPDRDLHIRVDCDIIQQNSFTAIAGKYRYIDFVRMKITDNGIGFNNQYAEYIFKLFKKLDADTAGLGFGLALCKKIVELHHGTISAEGTPGLGSTFTILLPLKQV